MPVLLECGGCDLGLAGHAMTAWLCHNADSAGRTLLLLVRPEVCLISHALSALLVVTSNTFLCLKCVCKTAAVMLSAAGRTNVASGTGRQRIGS